MRVEILDHALDRALDELSALHRIDVVVLDLDEDAAELGHRLIRILRFGRRLGAHAAKGETTRERGHRGEKNAAEVTSRRRRLPGRCPDKTAGRICPQKWIIVGVTGPDGEIPH